MITNAEIEIKVWKVRIKIRYTKNGAKKWKVPKKAKVKK